MNYEIIRVEDGALGSTVITAHRYNGEPKDALLDYANYSQFGDLIRDGETFLVIGDERKGALRVGGIYTVARPQPKPALPLARIKQ